MALVVSIAAAVALAACGGPEAETGSGATTGPASSPSPARTPGSDLAGQRGIAPSSTGVASISVEVSKAPGFEGTYAVARNEGATCLVGTRGQTPTASVDYKSTSAVPSSLAAATVEVPDLAKPTVVNLAMTLTAKDGTTREVRVIQATEGIGAGGELSGKSSLSYGEIGGGYTIRGTATTEDGASVLVRVSCGPLQ